MSMNSNFSVRKALLFAVGFLPTAFRHAWLVMALTCLVILGGQTFLATHFSLHFLAPVMVLLIFLLSLMNVGALYRCGLFGSQASKEGLGFGGLQFGAPEIRLLSAKIIVFAFVALLIVIILAVFAIALSLGGHEASLTTVHKIFKRHSGSDWLYIGYVVAALLFLIFVELKFSLMSAANVGQKKLVTLNALGLSSGYVGRLFLGLLVLNLPFLFVLGAAMKVCGLCIGSSPVMDSGLRASHMPILLHSIAQIASIVLVLPLTVGFLSSAYGQVRAIRFK